MHGMPFGAYAKVLACFIVRFLNRPQERQRAIAKWKARAIITIEENPSLLTITTLLVEIGLSAKDALHVACAIEGQADYFVTTDDKLIKKLVSFREIKAINPVDLVGLVDEN